MTANLDNEIREQLITVSVGSVGCTYGLLLPEQTGIMGLNSTWDMDVYLHCVCVVLCRDRPCNRLISCPRSPTKYL